MAYFLDTVIPDNAVFLFFLKAEQFGLFGTMTPVKGYVNKKTGKPVAPYTGLRRRALKKPDHPLSGNLFGHAADEVASSHIQPEPVKAKKPRKLSPEKLDAVRAKVRQIIAHAKVDALHAPKGGGVHHKLYLGQLANLKGLPSDELTAAQEEVGALFTPRVMLVDYTAEMAAKAPTKEKFYNFVFGKFADEKTSEKEKQALFDVLGLGRGVKQAEFRAAMDKYYDSMRGARKKRSNSMRQSLAESNVSQIMRHAHEAYTKDRAAMEGKQEKKAVAPNVVNPKSNGIIDPSHPDHFGKWTLHDYEERKKPEDYIDSHGNERTRMIGDWDNSETSHGSGKKIVNIYHLQHKDTGKIETFGQDTAYLAMGLRDKDTAKKQAEKILMDKKNANIRAKNILARVDSVSADSKGDAYFSLDERNKNNARGETPSLNWDTVALTKNGKWYVTTKNSQEEINVLKNNGWIETGIKQQAEPLKGQSTGGDGGKGKGNGNGGGKQQEYRYAMVNRPLGIGTAPKGYLRAEDRPKKGEPHYDHARHGVVVYNRKLTDQETKNFELAHMAGKNEMSEYADKVADMLGEYAEGYLEIANESQEEFLLEVFDKLKSSVNGHVPSIADRDAFVDMVKTKLQAKVGQDAQAPPAPEGNAAQAKPKSDTRDPDAEFLQTERAYGGRAAFKRALDAGKTKLNYRQWVQVRTPAFKQWFGDWENDAKLNLGIDALRQLADGKDEVTIQGIKPELKQFGGDSNIHLVWGDDKKGILHIGKKRGFERVAKVVAAALLGNQFDYAPAKKTVRVTHDGHTAVLSLDEHGKQKTWLLTGWEDGKPDAAGEVSATTGATHHTPTFSRGVMGAGLIDSIDQILPRGASKVVDDNGEPLVVYHGTSADFSEFSENAERLPWNADGAGHYFTSSKDSAAGYGDFVMPVFLRAKTPKISENFEHTKVTADQIKKLNGQGFDSIYFSGEYQNSSGKTVQGYDEYVAFAPTQIKSALGNRGRFDAKDPDITKAWPFPRGARFLFYRAVS